MKLGARVLILLGLLSLIPLRALASCLTDFAGLPDVADPTALVLDTYQELFDEVGRPVPPGVVTEMLEQGNPFEIPESKEVDLDGLRRHLKSFETMVRARGWEAQSIPPLLDLLRQRVADLREVEERREAAKLINRPSLLIPFPVSNRAKFSPDSRYVVSSNAPAGVKDNATWTLNVHDFVTGKTVEVPGGTGYHWGPFFAPDGKSLLFAGKGRFFTRVPFEGGKADWSKASTLGEKEGDAVFGRVHAGKDQRYIYASDENEGIWRFDLKTGKRVEAKLEPIVGGRKLAHWSASPDSNRLEVILRSSTSTLHFHQLEMKKDGALEIYKEETVSQLFSPEPNRTLIPRSAVWADGNKAIFVVGEKPATLYVVKKQNPDRLPKYDATFGHADLRTVVSHPTRNEVLALFQHQSKDRCWATIYDAKTGEAKGKLDLPQVTFDIQFSQDGTQLIAITNDGNVGLLNYIGPKE